MHKGVRLKMHNASLIERMRAASHTVGQKADPSTWDSWTVGAIAGGTVGAVLILWFLAWLCCCRRREESQRVMRRRGFPGFQSTMRVAGAPVDANELRTLIPTAAEVARHKNVAMGDLSGKYAKK